MIGLCPVAGSPRHRRVTPPEPSFTAPGVYGRPPERGTTTSCSPVVGELVTNAMRYTRGPALLHLELNGDHIDIRVTDTSPDPPQPRPPHLDGTGGWGWQLINHLTTDVHIEPTPDGGKTICARAPW